MSYIVTARKWRPMVFEDVVGQAHVTKTLRNAIATNRLSHSYIFSGPRGVGKTTTARILAKAINCLSPKDFNPDNKCELCTEITENRSVNVFEIDGASNRGVEEIRNLREAVRYAPVKGAYKVYIIDEVHMLTKEAFNALLKTLEEPPPHIVFIFATTEIHKVPLTILSRCQRFEFRRIAIEEITARLSLIAKAEKIKIDEDALMIIAKKGDGSLRDSQSIFDQIISFCGTTISGKQIIEVLNLVDEEMYFRLTDIIRSKDSKAGLALVEEVVNRGYDIKEFLSGLTEHLRNMLVVLTTGSASLIEVSEAYKKRYVETSSAFSELDILRLIKIVTEMEASLRWSQQPRFKLEIGLLQMIKMDSSIQIDTLLGQLDELKKKVNGKSFELAPAKPSITLEHTTEAPIRGNVKASQPTLKPEQFVDGSPYQIASSMPAASSSKRTTVAESIAARQAPAISLSTDEVIQKWPSMVEGALKERIALGTMLSEAKVSAVGDRIQVGCPDDFHLDTLTRNREFLTQLAQKVYGSKLRLETILSNEPATLNHVTTETQKMVAEPKQKMSSTDQHPVIQALIREFGAKEIGS